tara:strand:- start:9900 stop:10445 length:546 start_codon:yes stop_codon:yes gene_type:complete
VKIFRTHITKTYSLAVILLGFVLHFAEPIQESKTHSEFTSWLDAKVKTEDNSEIRKLISELADDAEELESVIRKASEIVSQNSEDFELPFGEEENPDVLDVIIDEWNAYQNSSAGMGKAVVVENIKSNAFSQKEAASLKKASKSVSESCMNNLVTVEAGWNTFSAQSFSKPFISGVAINAP